MISVFIDQIGTKGKYLKFYEKCMENDETMPVAGLCGNLGDTVSLFEPTKDEMIEYSLVSFTQGVFWGTEDEDTRPLYSFNPFRQNVTLFLAAMNGEL